MFSLAKNKRLNKRLGDASLEAGGPAPLGR